jgi:hypothetical protein
MKHKLLIVAGAPVVIGAAIAGALLLAYPVQVSKLAGAVILFPGPRLLTR